MIACVLAEVVFPARDFFGEVTVRRAAGLGVGRLRIRAPPLVTHAIRLATMTLEAERVIAVGSHVSAETEPGFPFLASDTQPARMLGLTTTRAVRHETSHQATRHCWMRGE